MSMDVFEAIATTPAMRRRDTSKPGERRRRASIPFGHPTGRWAEAKRRPIREITY
jgi:hypothetical protein